MNTQNTPIHIRLWHRHFWFLALAYLLMSIAVYSFLPTLPAWLSDVQGMETWNVAFSVGGFGVGMLLLGGCCNYLVQRYRRNMVCVCCLGGMIALLAFHYSVTVREVVLSYEVWIMYRLALGAVFGLSQMVLSGILVIDVCESYNRTEANYCMSWFCRLGLSVGPILGIVFGTFLSFSFVLLSSIVCLVAAVVLILSVHFPFRAPDDDIHFFSLDRFWLPQGWLLAANLLLFSLAIGMVFSVMHDLVFFAMLAVGLLASVLAQRIMFVDADLKSEVICGLFLVSVALLLNITRSLPVVSYVVPVLIGIGIGLVSGRFLLFFIKLSRHCKRGTSQSTYNISWEVGIWIGLALGYACDNAVCNMSVIPCAMAFTFVALLLYHFAAHGWYLKHKNR